MKRPKLNRSQYIYALSTAAVLGISLTAVVVLKGCETGKARSSSPTAEAQQREATETFSKRGESTALKGDAGTGRSPDTATTTTMGEIGASRRAAVSGLDLQTNSVAPTTQPMAPSMAPGSYGLTGRAALQTKPATVPSSPNDGNMRRTMSPQAATGAGQEALAAGAANQQRAFIRMPDVAGSLPSQHEELWVIQKFRPPQGTPLNDDLPGGGVMMCRTTIAAAPGLPAVEQLVVVPLHATDISATISGTIASTVITQQFSNPYNSKIEAVYAFPMPENAAVNDFVMIIGDRTIRAVIREKEEAKQIYAQARAQGYVASLLEQERPNIFVQKVANIEPGKQIDIKLTYFNTLPIIDGEVEWVVPLAIGPRFNPEAFYEGIAAVGRQSQPGASGQGTEIPYLRPNERTATKLSITARIDAGYGSMLSDVSSKSHVINVTPDQQGSRTSPAPQSVTLTLAKTDTRPNKDLVVRWKLSAAPGLFNHSANQSGSMLGTSLSATVGPDKAQYFNLLISAPQDFAKLPRQPLEMVFVLDCSGSMSGVPIQQAVAAAERGLRRLQPGDSFQVINFANNASQLGSAPLEATPENIERGVTYLRSLFAQGGTYMINGLRASLGFPADAKAERDRHVVLLTDGYIGNEAEILNEIAARIGPARIFSFGVGTSTNRYLLDAMAKLGRGAVAHINAGDSPADVMDRYFDRISHPALRSVKIDIPGVDPSKVLVFPREIPDVYAGRPVMVTGRIEAGTLASDQQWAVRIAGAYREGGEVRNENRTMVAEYGDRNAMAMLESSLPAIWARRKIADFADYATVAEARQMREVVMGTALRYNLMSAYTSFIAVDAMSKTAGNFGTTVVVPNAVPEGVRYDTTVK